MTNRTRIKLATFVSTIVFFVGLLCAAPAQAQGAGGYTLSSIDEVIQVNKDSSFDVVETVTGNFYEPRHGIYRQFPVRYWRSDGTSESLNIRIDSVTKDGELANYVSYREGDDLVVKVGDADVTMVGDFSYSFVYHVERGILFHDLKDELYWNVSEDAWGTPVPLTTASITLPEPDVRGIVANCYTGPVGSTESNCQLSVEKDLITSSANDFLTLSILFPKLVVYEPGFNIRAWWWLQDNWDFLSLLVPLFTLLFLFVRWWRIGRDPKGRGTIVAEYEPVDKLRPTELGTLIDARLHPRDFSAGIVDLAVRGYLTIIEEEHGALGFTSRSYTLRKQKPADGLLKPFERALLEGLFAKETEVKIEQRQSSLVETQRQVKKFVYSEMASLGYYVRNPETVRWFYFGIGIAVAVFGHMIGIAGATITDRPVALFAMYTTAGFILLFAPFMPCRTRKGALAAEHALGFKLYLEAAEKYRLQWQEKEHIFEKFLPYAMVFGVADKWSKAFADVQKTPPGWYQGNMAAFNPVLFSSRMNSFANAASHAAAPSSSGGSGGGGFSGGGFGGGGGGSW